MVERQACYTSQKCLLLSNGKVVSEVTSFLCLCISSFCISDIKKLFGKW
uniref:Uncharacterized protein MANES_01G101600 n=1 Tax=Rhizophora mucronata TaxID=61149 RepID=A0A2P2MDK8_RHIMU